MREIKFRGKSIKTGKWHYGSLLTTNNGWAFITDMLPNNEVKPATVGEFTGFKDIDGNEIYEGDIIQNDAHPDTIERVFMYDGCWSVGFYHDEANPLAWTLENAPFKVIGNMHDNPKLLEGGK